MERLTREMTFEEEYTFLKKEVKELFDKEDRKSEPPESHCVVRRALRCIKKLFAELEPYKEYKDLEEQGLLLRLPCKVGDRLYKIDYDYLGNIISDTIHSIHILRNTVYLEMKYWHDISLSEVGKTTFLTQAEAEQKLKEMNTDNGIAEQKEKSKKQLSF